MNQKNIISKTGFTGILILIYMLIAKQYVAYFDGHVQGSVPFPVLNVYIDITIGEQSKEHLQFVFTLLLNDVVNESIPLFVEDAQISS